MLDDDDGDVGGYVHGGATVEFGGPDLNFSTGIDVRSSYGLEADLFGASTDLDYLQVAVLFGVRF